MKIKITQPGIAEDGNNALYPDGADLPMGWSGEVSEVWQYKHGDEWLTNQQSEEKMNNIPDCYKRRAYIATIPAPDAQPVKAVEEENEMYYCLSDNGDLNGLYLASMREVSEHVEMDLCDVEPLDRHKVQYTITPVFMTETEFNNLPEYEG